jgi:hypothetical protein
MPFAKPLPEWNVLGTKPPQSKIDAGWGASEKPPADWFNWIWNTTYQAMSEMQQSAVHTDRIGVTVASLVNGKVPASQLDVQAPADATTNTKGIVMLEDSTSSTSITKAATPKSVKTAYDLALSRSTFSGSYNDLTNKPNASAIPVVDSTNKFVSTNVEGVLEELFTSASNGKASIANAAGVPSVSSDTFSKIANDITTGKANIASAITSKGGSATGADSWDTLVSAIQTINLNKRMATGTTTTNGSYKLIVSGLAFTPKLIIWTSSDKMHVGIYNGYSTGSNYLKRASLSVDNSSSNATKSSATITNDGFTVDYTSIATLDWIAFE